jgi:hypothetical protein
MHGTSVHPDQLRRLDATVAGKDRVVAIDQDRIGETELT